MLNSPVATTSNTGSAQTLLVREFFTIPRLMTGGAEYRLAYQLHHLLDNATWQGGKQVIKSVDEFMRKYSTYEEVSSIGGITSPMVRIIEQVCPLSG